MAQLANQLRRIARWLRMVTVAASLTAGGSGQGAPAQVPAPPSAPVIITIAGQVEVAPAGTTNWTTATTNQSLRMGDLIRTGERSRATLRLSDRSVLPIDELSLLTIEAPTAATEKPTLNLRQGALYLFSREKPEQLQMRTRRARAAIRGTEFHLRAELDGRTELTLIEGTVDLSNAEGASIPLHTGEQGIVPPAGPPSKTAMLDTRNLIQWVLYYPAVLDLADLPAGVLGIADLAPSLDAYRRGNILEALRLVPFARPPLSAGEEIYRAAVLLAAGRVEAVERAVAGMITPAPASTAPEADRTGRLARALATLVAAVKLEDRSKLEGPQLATEWLALSYFQQAHGQLEQALASARLAVERSPGFSYAWARLAELEFGFGRTETAQAAVQRALREAPDHAYAWSVSGFLWAARNDVHRARADFEKAISLDANLGNAWLGRGLSRIRQGQLPAGVRDLEVAAALEPNRALFRSYLGKAWQERNDFSRARRELELGQRLDPAEPTSWFYSALLHREQNRINAAVRDLERAQDLNQNRQLFRSRLLLDQDRAVRGANLAAIYRDAGMIDVGFREASRAVQSDYANAAAHLFLANSYNELRDLRQVNLRYETPTFNELLLANLLAPVGASALSQNISQQEYSRLFERDQVGFSSSTEYFSSGDWVQYASQFGRMHNTAYALDVIHRSQNGQRPNEDFSEETFHAKVQQQLTARDTLYWHAIYYDNDAGDLTQYYDPAQAHPRLRIKEAQEPLLLAGYHREWSPGNHTLAIAGRLADTLFLADPSQQALATLRGLGGQLTPLGPIQFDLAYRSELEIYTAELQQIVKRNRHTLVAGGRYQRGTFETAASLSKPSSLAFAFGDPAAADQLTEDFQRISAYAYHFWSLPGHVQLNAGLAWDHLEFPQNWRNPPLQSGTEHRNQLSPKAGIIWEAGPQTTFRAAYAQSLGGASLDQSIRLEPTQMGGLNQSYRSLIPESVAGSVAAPQIETAGAALDQRLFRDTYVGIGVEHLHSLAWRDLGAFSIRFAPPAASREQMRQRLEYDERAFTAYLHQLLSEEWSLGARYRFAVSELDTRFAQVTGGAFENKGDLHQLRLHLLFNHASGFFSSLEGLWTAQTSRGYQPELEDESFGQFNLFAGYRFPRRQAEIRVGLLNVTDQDYRLNPLTFYAELPRERTFTARIKFNF